MRVARTPSRRERAELPALRALAWAAGSLFAFAAPALGTPPVPGTPMPTRVELWHGIQQVGSFPPLPAEETRPVQAESGPALPAPPALDPALPATPLPRQENTGPLPPPPDNLLSTQFIAPEAPPTGSKTTEESTPVTPPSAPAPVTRVEKPTVAASEAPVPPAAVARPPQPDAQTTPERETAARGVSSDLIFQVACVFGAAFLGPLVSAAVLLLLLRRYARRSGALFRIEHVGGPASPSVEAMSILAAREALLTAPGWGGRLGERAGLPAGPSRAEEIKSGERFELGPTCEQAYQSKAAQAEQQEQNLLQQFFEENLRLQEQIERSRKADE